MLAPPVTKSGSTLVGLSKLSAWFFVKAYECIFHPARYFWLQV